MRRWKEASDVNLDVELVKQIQSIGREYDLKSIILYGSRATKKNWEKSDIDICLDIEDSVLYLEVQKAFEERVRTLLRFDICNKQRFNYSAALDEEIERDGVILYEKV